MKKGSALVWIFGGGVALASASFGVVACSSNPSLIDNTVPGPDSSTNKDTGNNSKPDTSVDPDAGPTPDGSSGCANPPKLFPPSMKGLYCPFSFSGDAGSAYCKVGTQKCCLSPSSDAGPSTCTATATPCPMNDSVWACSAPEECNGGVCCLTAGPTEADPNCAGYMKTKGFNNTRCTTAQACMGTIDAGKFVDNQYVVCTKQADCAMGTCTAIKTTGTSIGICM